MTEPEEKFVFPTETRKSDAVLHENMPMDTYHDFGKIWKHPDSYVLSKSMLSDFNDCPEKFRYKYLVPPVTVEEKVDYLNTGTAVHTLALEPQEFDRRIYVIPEGIRRDKRTADYKKCIQDAGDRIMITSNQYDNIRGMAAKLGSDPMATALLDGPGYIEASVFYTCPHTGLRKRVRPDWFRRDGKLIVNIKTAQSAKPELFNKSAAEYCYDMGAAMELEAVEALMGPDKDRNYVLLVIETEPPHIISAFDTKRPMSFHDEDDNTPISYAEAGAGRVLKSLYGFQSCMESGIWPGYVQGIQPMRYPGWMMKRILETGEK